MRRFQLVRDVDISGISGTGLVAEGVIATDGTVAIRWLGVRPSWVIWHNVEDPEYIHGHGGATRFVFLDD